MSDNPNDHQSGNNYFAGIDAFNSMNDSWFPSPPQPAFGQSWSGPVWNSMPLPNYNFSSPFQAGFPLTQNDSIDQNQQTGTHDYSEDDDFYESEKSQPKNKPNDSDEPCRTSMASQVNVSPASEVIRARTNTPTTAATVQPQEKNEPTLTPIPTTTKSSLIKGPDARLSELRQKLLASKRANSATPVPSITNMPNGIATDNAIKEAVRPENVRFPAETVKTKDVNFNASTMRGNTTLPENKSTANISNILKSAPAQADIQGLIDEYRAPDTVNNPKEPSNLTSKGDKLKRSPKFEMTKTGNETNRIEEAKPCAVTIKTPLQPPSGSTGSSESGEIRSDQDTMIPSTGTDSVHSSARKLDSIPSSGFKSATPVSASDKPPASKAKQGDARTSKSTPISSTLKQGLQPRATDQRLSARSTTESRAVPHAPKLDYTRKGASQASNLQALPGDRPQRRLGVDQHDSHSHRNAKPSSSLAKPAPPQAYQEAHDEVSKHQQRSERVTHEEHLARPQEQATEQHQISSLPEAEVGTNENLPSEQKEMHYKPTATDLALSAGSSSDKLHQNSKCEVSDPVPCHQGRNLLSLTQQEQIQKLGIDLTPEGLTDLYDFLEYHRFFVKEYREGFLARQRRLRALDAEKLALERESLMQYEIFNSMRAQSLVAREPTETPALVGLQDSKESNETPSAKPMPPPLSLPRKSYDAGAVAIKGRASSVENVSPKYPVSRANADLAPGVVQDGSNLKRQHLDEGGDFDRSRKSSRMDLDSQQSDRSQQISPKTSRNEYQILERRRLSDLKAANHSHRDRSRSPNDRPRSLSPFRRIPDYTFSSRQSSWVAPSTRERDQPRPSAEELRRESAGALCRNCDRIGHFTADCRDTRRRSGSYDVRAQRYGDDGFRNDGSAYPSRGNGASSTSFRAGSRGGRSNYQSYKPILGSTPFRSSASRHGAGVPNRSDTLNFKAGDSRYFMIKSWNVENVEAAQRDARMQSLPSPDIPAPDWQKVLLWSSTDPFRIEWIAVAETRFHAVGHLKNAYNEGQAVLIGRDGQEIEEVCGRALCELIDETAKEQARYEDGY
ncbi:MAG: hypothetical protein Q9216_005112 [Gyalolechia sp. 2 TL-2023]